MWLTFVLDLVSFAFVAGAAFLALGGLVSAIGSFFIK